MERTLNISSLVKEHVLTWEKSKMRLLFRIPTDPVLWILLSGEDSIKLLKRENVKFI